MFTCSVCKKSGHMYLEGGVIGVGQFKTIGKAEQGHLILECKDCKRRFYFDPIFGKEIKITGGVIGDTLDFFAQQELTEKQ